MLNINGGKPREQTEEEKNAIKMIRKNYRKHKNIA